MSTSVQHVVISGGSGLVGQALLKHLPSSVERVTILSRNSSRTHPDPRVHYSAWNPAQGELDDAVLSTADAIVNLAGANVGQRWTASHKKAIIDSRLDSTGLLVQTAQKHPRIQVMVSASAIGLYPDAPEVQSEEATGDDSFISQVVQKWEEAWQPLVSSDTRTCALRIGLVLANEDGFFKKLKPVFKLGLGAALGGGKQLVSWIHIDDLARMFVHALTHAHVAGVYNAVAPQVLSNKAFSKEMASAMNRPLLPIGVPAFALKLVMGEMSQVALRSVGVTSKKILDTGFQWEHASVTSAVQALMKA